MIRKVGRQPYCATISGTAIAPAAPPSVRPVLDRPSGSAQLPGGNQRTTLVLTTGKVGAWVAPTRKRTSISIPTIRATEKPSRPGTRLVAAVRMAHITAIAASMRRGPIRSPNTPPGNWNIV
jgi:hypothetical protein